MRNTLYDPVVVHLPCAYCGASPGQRCQAHPSDSFATYVHRARDLAAREIADSLGLEEAWDAWNTTSRKLTRIARTATEVADVIERVYPVPAAAAWANTLRAAVTEARS